MSRIILSDGCGLLRTTAKQRETFERLLYHRYPDREWGTYFRFGFRRTAWGLLICWVDLIPPQPGDLDRQSHIVEFQPAYIRRALRTLETCELGIGVIHSHPEDSAVSPSRLDNDMDRYFGSEFERYGEGRPYVSLIVARDRNGQRGFSGRAFDRGKWFPIEEWYVCGDDVLERHHAQAFLQREPLTSSVERLTQLYGHASVRRLRNSRIGIVGCSGLGSPAVHVLARSGIGNFVLIDKGRYKDSNHERNHASRASDLESEPMWKAELLRRFIAEINPTAVVTSIVGDVLDEEVIDELTRCDLILGCTDSIYARAALGELSTHYLVPVLDLAVQMSSREGRLREQVGELARYTPGLPCPWCRGRIDAQSIREETMTDEEKESLQDAALRAKERGEDGAQYWNGARPQELTVGYMTTAVGAIGAGYAQHWLAGAARMPHDRFQFDLGLPDFGFVKDRRPPEADCSCQRTIGHAEQGRAERKVSKPTHWPPAFIVAK